jgi:imidazolonepropionase-like amidohydrolase
MRPRKLSLAALLALALAGFAFAIDPVLPEPRTEFDKDRKPKTHTGGNVLIEKATVLTVVGPPLEETDVLVLSGKIAAIGKGLGAAPGVLRIDARGRFVAPGAIDCHSHIAIAGGVNEMADKISAECRIKDVIDPKDVSIYRALAGGTTTAHLLHGSGNPIGGQDAVIKLRYGKDAAGLLFEGAPQGIKFALGENPTRGQGFPQTRMGMVATYRRAFTEARDYARTWKTYEDAKARGEDPPPPRRDLRLEAIAHILDGSIKIHCHCYRADEILAFLGVCEEFGVRVQTLQHVLEGYKIASEIQRHGAGCSTFSDWWAYKVEVMNAVPGNAAICTRAGVVTSINSDSEELIRHLFLESAKCVRHGGLTENEALALCTLNPAKQLGIDARTGSIEVGKDADIAIWNGHPLSAFSHPILVLVDGEVYFERSEGPRAVDGSAGLPDPASFKIAKDPGPAPAPPPSTHACWAIKGARIEPVSSALLERANIIIRGSKIESLGPDARVPEDATVIDGAGLTVTPGFIEAGSWLGLREIDMLKVTRDDADSGDFQPDLVALTAVHPESEHILVTRAHGIALGVALPAGGLVPGQASLVRLAGWTAGEMDVRSPVGLVVEFPSRPPGPPEGGSRPKRFDRLDQLVRFFERARDDLERRERTHGTPLEPEPDPRLQAMAPYLKRELPVIFAAEDARTILDALVFADEQKVKPVILGARDAWKVAKVLASKDVPVILGPVLDVPALESDPADACYANAAVLADAGVRVAIRSGGSGYAGPRNLPFEAAMAASYGLGRARALAAITKVPAEILGVGSVCGTLEPNKSADVVVSLGDPLEPTSYIRYLFIDGRPVSLESKQTRLEAEALSRLESKRAH